MRASAFAVLLCACAAAPAEIPVGDSRRGAEVFRDQRCVECHSLAGKGGYVGPDLGRLIGREFTTASLAATMWNHAPVMWAAMRKQGVVAATLSPESAADLFAYFYSVRFFDHPGDAGRGKAVFASRRCAECHGVTTSSLAAARPVSQWESTTHPVALAQNMWNHAAGMRAAMDQKRIPWPQLTGQELTDILVWVRNLPGGRRSEGVFRYDTAAGGEEVFRAKGCQKCHGGLESLAGRIHGDTLTDIAVAMWNHAPRMPEGAAANLSEEEMRKLLSYLWARQFFQGQGSAERGRRVFEAKRCATCHQDPSSGAPSLAALQGDFSSIRMMSVLWDHGPRMLERMRDRKIEWPRFETGQMADLIAYLDRRP
jgi:cytochrome c2